MEQRFGTQNRNAGENVLQRLYFGFSKDKHPFLNGSIGIAIAVIHANEDSDMAPEEVERESCVQLLSYMLAFMSTLGEEDHPTLWNEALQYAVAVYGKTEATDAAAEAWKVYRDAMDKIECGFYEKVPVQ